MTPRTRIARVLRLAADLADAGKFSASLDDALYCIRKALPPEGGADDMANGSELFQAEGRLLDAFEEAGLPEPFNIEAKETRDERLRTLGFEEPSAEQKMANHWANFGPGAQGEES